MIQVQKFLNQTIDFVLPPRCVVSGQIVDRQGVMAPQAWQGLRFISAPFCGCCGLPFEFEVDEDDTQTLCVSCLEKPPPFETARMALVYDDASREIILRFKHADKLEAAPVFVPWLKQAGREMLAQADIIVPVPLHRKRLLKRRYNQAALIAKELARDTGISCFPAALARYRATVSQGHMDVKDRHKNVKNAFAVPLKYRAMLKGKTVVLVDDVYTTGATVNECTRTLLKAGVQKVHVLAVARVIRH